MKRRVALTGRAIVSPLGVGIDAHWHALMEGRRAIATLPRLAALGLAVSRGAEVAPELIQPYLARLPRKQQKLYNRATLLGMLPAALAMEDAQLGGLFCADDRGARGRAADSGTAGGFAAGEGRAVLVLAERGRARARGAAVHGQSLGDAAGVGSGRLVRDLETSPAADRLAR